MKKKSPHIPVMCENYRPGNAPSHTLVLRRPVLLSLEWLFHSSVYSVQETLRS